MGYSTNRKIKTRVFGHLKLLDKKATIKFSTENPSSLAYNLRQALFASQFHRDFHHFGELRRHYVFEVQPGCVIARFSSVEKPEESQHFELKAEIISETPDYKEEVYGEEVQEILSATTLPGAVNLDAVIGGVIKYGTQVDEIYFPDAILSEGEKARLYRWATTEEWQVVDSEEGGITLTQRDVPEGIVWKPREERND